MQHYKDTKISYFTPPVRKKKQVPTGTWTLEQIYNLIRGNELKSITDKIRNLPTDEEKREAKQTKLPFVTFGGTFNHRNSTGLIQGSNFIGIDLDHLDDSVQYIKKAILSKFKPVLMHTSVRGGGLHVVCCVKESNTSYKNLFNALRDYFVRTFSITYEKVDQRFSNVVQASFLCHDPDVYMSDIPTVFSLDYLNGTIMDSDQQILTDNFGELFRRGVKWVEEDQKLVFAEGNRYNYIVSLTTYLNRVGAVRDKAEQKLLGYVQPGFTDKQIIEIIRGIYEKTILHGTRPMNIRPGKEDYITFNLQKIWVSDDQYLDSIQEILSTGTTHERGKIPTSLKIEYLEDCLRGKITPDLLRLMAAAKSVIGLFKKRKSTTRIFLWGRMWGYDNEGRPRRRFKDYYFRKLMDKALERKLIAKIPKYRRIVISIELSLEQLEKAMMEDIRKKHDRKQKTITEGQRCGQRLKEYEKALSTP